MSATPRVAVLDRQFRLLQLFLSDRPSWSLADFVRASRIPKSTVHRLVSVLFKHELLWRDPQDDRYRLGSLAVRIGQNALAQRDLRRVAWPILNQLAKEIGETVILATLNASRDRAVYVEQIVSQQGVRLVPQIGVQLPLHAGGMAKAMLAFLDDQEIECLLAQPLERLARGTKTDPDALRAEIRKIRQMGYALSFEETYNGATGMAVLIFDHDGKILASLGVAGPTPRVMPVEQWADQVRREARRLEAAIGGQRVDNREMESTPRRSARGDETASDTTLQPVGAETLG